MSLREDKGDMCLFGVLPDPLLYTAPTYWSAGSSAPARHPERTIQISGW